MNRRGEMKNNQSERERVAKFLATLHTHPTPKWVCLCCFAALRLGMLRLSLLLFVYYLCLCLYLCHSLFCCSLLIRFVVFLKYFSHSSFVCNCHFHFHAHPLHYYSTIHTTIFLFICCCNLYYHLCHSHLGLVFVGFC